MLGALWLLEPNLDSCSTYLVVTNKSPELRVRRCGIRPQRCLSIAESISRIECYG